MNEEESKFSINWTSSIVEAKVHNFYIDKLFPESGISIRILYADCLIYMRKQSDFLRKEMLPFMCLTIEIYYNIYFCY